jgi:hypothetical protein
MPASYPSLRKSIIKNLAYSLESRNTVGLQN